jgi:hypothetical protein
MAALSAAESRIADTGHWPRVSGDDPVQPFFLHGNRLMSASSQFLFYSLQLRSHAVTLGISVRFGICLQNFGLVPNQSPSRSAVSAVSAR